MLPQTLRKDRFNDFVRFLMDGYRLVAPVAKGPQFAFAEIESADEIDRIRMEYTQTILPPKKFLLPQYEKLLSFSGPGPDGVKAETHVEPTVMLGVHPYDLHGLATTDKALCQDPMDPNYIARRQSSVLIGVNIGAYANEHQFMADMNTLEPPEDGYDLFLTDLGDHYYVEIGSELGSRLAKGSGCCTPARSEDHQARQRYDAEKAVNCEKRLPYKVQYLPELLDQSYESLLWDAVAKRCFSCGACTNVCPTCYCFDVQDKLEIDATSGARQRMWDSCQLKMFAEVAGGENFREHRASRLRHRMFRKGKFVLEQTGKSGCVGCGRCSLHCVANISILESFQQIGDAAVALDS
jgi:sulfhydrogenase subunit beta (sulfur reductase)